MGFRSGLFGGQSSRMSIMCWNSAISPDETCWASDRFDYSINKILWYTSALLLWKYPVIFILQFPVFNNFLMDVREQIRRPLHFFICILVWATMFEPIYPQLSAICKNFLLNIFFIWHSTYFLLMKMEMRMRKRLLQIVVAIKMRISHEPSLEVVCFLVSSKMWDFWPSNQILQNNKSFSLRETKTWSTAVLLSNRLLG